jgi:hypothetical protein
MKPDISTERTFSTDFEGWVSLAILEPEHLQTRKARFQVDCGRRQESLQRMQVNQHHLGRV